ncbi:MAG: ATP-dependent DNA helicase [Patescibacteria group bacterium]
MEEILADLNDAQKAAVTHPSGPQLVLAGAGTGKTTVITRRLAWLIREGQAKTSEVLALTFTDKAAGELEERLDKLLPYGYTDLWVSTFHAFGQRLLERHGLDIGLPHSFKVLSETEQWLLVRQNLDRFALSYYRPLGNPTKFIHALVRHFSRMKDEGVLPSQYATYAEDLRLDSDQVITRRAKRKKSVPDVDEAARLEEVAHAYTVYQTLLREQSALDFGDLILEAVRLLETRPDLLASYRAMFRHVLVDEFQDTNASQYRLVKLLAAPNNNLTVVGDDDQAIYRFRGAAMSNILQFRKEYPTAVTTVLTKNYRSNQTILDAAYAFIQHNNPNRLETTLTATDGAQLSKQLQAARPEIGVIRHRAGQTDRDEQELIIRDIRAFNAGGSAWGSMAILARSNEVANDFAAALAAAHVPHQSHTARGLYRTPSTVDALSYLKLLDNYHESVCLWRVLLLPCLGMPHVDAVAVSHYSTRKSLSLFEGLQDVRVIPNISKEGLRVGQRVLDLIATHAAMARTRRPSEVFVSAFTDLGYTTAVEKEGDAIARQTFSHLNQFYERIRRWEATQDDPRLREFLEVVRFEADAGETGPLAFDPEIGPDAVQVMTVHAAKGLEFDHVFIVGLVDRRFPAISRPDPVPLPKALLHLTTQETGDSHVEEERRLFYVALTRARHTVTVSSFTDFGGARAKKPSRFLLELGVPLAEPESVAVSPFATGRNDVTTPPPYLFPEPVQEHFSYSALKAFETCPLQYRYAHVLRVPTWGRHTFSFGKSLHATLELFFQDVAGRQQKIQAGLFTGEKPASVTVPSLSELLKLYEEAWIDEWYPDKKIRNEYYAQGRRMLRAFYARHQASWPNVRAVEQPFTLHLDQFTVRGKIDRIDEVDGGIAIVDYKTGKVPSEKNVDRNQLLIYQLAAERLWNERPMQLTFYYLETGETISFRATPGEVATIEDTLRTTIAAVQRGSFPATPSQPVCRQCDFRTICPFSKA